MMKMCGIPYGETSADCHNGSLLGQDDQITLTARQANAPLSWQLSDRGDVTGHCGDSVDAPFRFRASG